MFYWLWRSRPCHHLSLHTRSDFGEEERRMRRRRPAAPCFQSRTSSRRMTKQIRSRTAVAFKDAAAQGGAVRLRDKYCLSAGGQATSKLIVVSSGPWLSTLRRDRVCKGHFCQNLESVWFLCHKMTNLGQNVYVPFWWCGKSIRYFVAGFVHYKHLNN